MLDKKIKSKLLSKLLFLCCILLLFFSKFIFQIPTRHLDVITLFILSKTLWKLLYLLLHAELFWLSVTVCVHIDFPFVEHPLSLNTSFSLCSENELSESLDFCQCVFHGDFKVVFCGTFLNKFFHNIFKRSSVVSYKHLYTACEHASLEFIDLVAKIRRGILTVQHLQWSFTLNKLHTS